MCSNYLLCKSGNVAESHKSNLFLGHMPAPEKVPHNKLASQQAECTFTVLVRLCLSFVGCVLCWCLWLCFVTVCVCVFVCDCVLVACLLAVVLCASVLWLCFVGCELRVCGYVVRLCVVP